MGVDATWLAARVAADDAARAVTMATQLPRLIDEVRPGPGEAVRVIDVGAGSGANQRWLAPRLPFAQHWVHLDHDPAILEHTRDVAHTEFVVGGIDSLADLLDAGTAPTVITCAAVLDVLTRADLALLGRMIIEHRVPALLSLSVTGRMTLEPAAELDAPLLAAFNTHQRRGGRAGPDAPSLLEEQSRATGAHVLAVDTPWLLTAESDQDFVTRFLDERVTAAVEQEPGLRDVAQDWLAQRAAQLADGRLEIVVEHRDLLVLPART